MWQLARLPNCPCAAPGRPKSRSESKLVGFRRHAPTRLCSAVLTDQQDSSVTAIADAASRLSANAEHTIQNLEASTSSSVSQGGNWSKTLLEQLVPVQAVAAETVQAPQVPESLQQQSPANQARNWIQAPVEQLNPPVQAPQLPDTAPTVDQARELFKASVKQLESAQKAATEAPQGTESVQQPPPAAHWGTEQLKSLHAPHIPDSVQQLVTGLHSQQSEGNAEVPSAHFGTNAALSALQGAIDAFNSTLQIFPQAQVPGLDGVKQAVGKFEAAVSTYLGKTGDAAAAPFSQLNTSLQSKLLAGGQEGRSLEPHFGSQAATKAAGAVSGWFSRPSAQPQDSGPPPDLTLQSAINAVKQAIQASAA